MNTPQKKATYATVLKLLSKVPSPKSLLGQIVASVIGVIIVLGGTCLFFKLEGKDVLSSAAPLVLLLVVGLFLLIAPWIRRILDLRQSPAEQRKRELRGHIGFHLRPKEGSGGIFVLRHLKSKNANDFVFPRSDGDDGLLQVAVELNYRIFRYTAFGDSQQNKIDRNSSHQHKNANAIMLIRRPSPSEERQSIDEWIGFTHVLPVSRYTYDRYLDGKISDNTFSADHICAPNEAAYAIIVFSMGIDRYKIKSILTAESKSQNLCAPKKVLAGLLDRSCPPSHLLESDVFLREALFFHVRHMLREQRWESGTVKVIAQSLNKKVIQMLELAYFRELPSERRSADNEPIFELQLATK